MFYEYESMLLWSLTLRVWGKWQKYVHEKRRETIDSIIFLHLLAFFFFFFIITRWIEKNKRKSDFRNLRSFLYLYFKRTMSLFFFSFQSLTDFLQDDCKKWHRYLRIRDELLTGLLSNSNSLQIRMLIKIFILARFIKK